MFDQDRVDLLKPDGSVIEGILSTVSGSNLIVIKMGANLGKSIVVRPTDLLRRRLSNGDEETYEVIDPVFYERGPGGAHYQLKVKKLGLPEAKAAVQRITYNLTGNNSRVNIESVDNSTNLAVVNSQVGMHLDELRRELSSLGLTSQEEAEALEIVDEVQQQFVGGKPKRSIVTALLSSLPHAANILKIGAAISAFL